VKVEPYYWYSWVIFSMNQDLLDWALCNIPGLPDIDMSRLAPTRAISMVLYEILVPDNCWKKQGEDGNVKENSHGFQCHHMFLAMYVYIIFMVLLPN
jgi:hypothetical protein